MNTHSRKQAAKASFQHPALWRQALPLLSLDFPHSAMEVILLKVICLTQKYTAVIKGNWTLFKTSVYLCLFIFDQLQNRHYMSLTSCIIQMLLGE